eukprot:CAMPEP_0174724462 /NCGR_PEP_ID=MMETSP1094-20130205/43374_1 /TAXON_ID=156173 /ORGANISM="Chrysochromulina brevifilum, Strain UTEX LB 985" /LENGTH=135 /DNA_ID=CAMNT_0015925685 /DNA_START=363 /DNA_END=770 /DNA_ORIENTATION=+
MVSTSLGSSDRSDSRRTSGSSSSSVGRKKYCRPLGNVPTCQSDAGSVNEISGSPPLFISRHQYTFPDASCPRLQADGFSSSPGNTPLHSGSDARELSSRILLDDSNDEEQVPITQRIVRIPSGRALTDDALCETT